MSKPRRLNSLRSRVGSDGLSSARDEFGDVINGRLMI
jgi:hypothetical protein